MRDSPVEMSELHILDSKVYQCLDAFMILLLRSQKYSLLPDLAGVFGPEAVVKFLDIFAGTTIKVPSRELLQELIREAHIYHAMSNNSAIKKTLAEQYEISEVQVELAYHRVKVLMEGVADG